MFTSGYLEYRLRPERIQEFTSILEETSVRINRDFTPTGFFNGLRYWGSAFAPRAADVYNTLANISFYYYLAAAAGLILSAHRLLFTAKAASANRLTFLIGTSGIAAMAFDLFTLFAFQSLFGYIYLLTGFFLTAFMGGMYLGGHLSCNFLADAEDDSTVLARLLKLDVAVIVLLIGFNGVVVLMRAAMALPGAIYIGGAMTAVYTAASGGMVGAQFPLAVRVLPAPWGGSAGKTAGRLYSADLAGGCLGAILVSLLLFPLLGLPLTLFLLAVLKLASLISLRFRGVH